LAQLIFGKTVVVHWYKLSYKRLVGNVFVDGKDVGLELVRAGLAWHYKDYEHEQSDDARVQYAIAEVRARSAKRGLWQQRDPLAPWEYRHGRRIVITPEAEATAPPR
jgi:endonuclease YncB( thermonuclease family)